MPVAPVVPQVDKADFDRLAARLSETETKLSMVEQGLRNRQPETDPKLVERILGLEGRLQAVENRAVAPSTPRPGVSVPEKPKVVPGWTLKGVAKGTAWLQGPGGTFIQASVGDDIGGDAGTVRSISKYNDDWIVMTTTGVILRK
jgi:hypothetical protein